MAVNNYLPFERNRFYVGKLLTTADFVAEQNYFINKRRFVNSLMFGSGIICGLSVFSLDDVSIMIDSGAAIDDFGREIVLAESVVRKLSSIEGFEGLTTDCATLCLRYEEEPVHPVYAIGRQGQGDDYELNRIREKWQLFLVDSEKLGPPASIESEFFSRERLFEDENFSAELTIPSSISCGSTVKLELCVNKLSDADIPLSLDLRMQTPSLEIDGGHELNIKLTDLRLAKGESVVREYWLRAQSKPTEETILIIKPEMAKITAGETDLPLEHNIMLKTCVADISVPELVAREAAMTSLEMRNIAGRSDFVRLAELTLQFSKNSYIIDKVIEQGVKRYIKAVSGSDLRQDYSQWFGGGESASAPEVSNHRTSAEQIPAVSREPQFTSGTCEISLGNRARKNEIFISDEIMHGLGKGNVYVDVGIEFLTEDKQIGGNERQTIYGDPTLFKLEDNPAPYANTAVRVFNDRGSFVVAVKLLRDTNHVLLVLRWVAIRFPAPPNLTASQRMAGKSISVVPPTVTLGTGESHYLNVQFKNMEPCSLKYRLTEKDSGEITTDGVYTAPQREGVFEILVSCTDMPFICTYAYAIVKKKDKDREKEDVKKEEKV